MDKLKALIEQKKKAAEEEFGDRKYVKRSEIEAVRLKRLRDEEQREYEAKEAKKRQKLAEFAAVPELVRNESLTKKNVEQLRSLSKEEVVRRLRLLNQPIVLFGESEEERVIRLARAEEELDVGDEHATGQHDNLMLHLQRTQHKDAKGGGGGGAAAAVAAVLEPDKAQTNGDGEDLPDGTGAAANGEGEDEDPTMAAFKRAAQALREQREEEALAVEDRIRRWLKRWCREWGEDLEARPEAVKDTATGNHATLMYKQTVAFITPLIKQLERRQVIPEMVAGLWIIVQAMRERNYLHAYDIYMRLSIGNSPWPIGVTSVGIHERSAREKISHVMNGAAHIMNDEATRKYLQAIKRLLTFVQRAYPTDPSRSVDFDAFRDAGRGSAGSGSDKLALLEAEQKHQTWRDLGLPAAPNVLDKDGSVKVPPKWENIVAHSEVFRNMAKEASSRTPPRTPPKSPLK